MVGHPELAPLPNPGDKIGVAGNGLGPFTTLSRRIGLDIHAGDLALTGGVPALYAGSGVAGRTRTDGIGSSLI